MIESFILEGDIVIAEKTSAVRDGDMVVALVDNSEATLKYFYKERSKDRKKHKIKLQPANKKYEPFIYNPGEVEVQGKVVKVVRDYR
jgi:repressor LexA